MTLLPVSAQGLGCRTLCAHIPEEARQLRRLLELVDSARQHGVRFGYVAEWQGSRLSPRPGDASCNVHKHQRIWLDDPAPYRPATTSRGRHRSAALTVAEWAAQQPVSAWKRIKLRQGEKGTLKAEYLHARVWAWDRKEETAREHRADASTFIPSGTHARLPRARLPGGQERVGQIRCVAGMPGIATWRWSWLPCCFCSRSA